MLKRSVLVLVLISATLLSNAQSMSQEQYVSQFFRLAIEEMNQFKIPASITLAQGLLESSNGNSDLATKALNHFGIKCKSDWTGMKFIQDDDTRDECFRAYNSVEDSYRDHSIFLQKDRYAKLFTYDMQDYRSWAYGLKAAGYATNPKYPQLLINLIETLKLYQFDNYGQSNVYETKQTKQSEAEKKIEAIEVSTVSDIANDLKLVKVNEIFDINQIAKENNISVDKLAKYNEIENEQPLLIGQNFFLEPKKDANRLSVHEVKRGQSIYDISQIYGVRTLALRKYNNMELWEQPIVGEIVYLASTKPQKMQTRPYFEVQKEKNNTQSILYNSTESNSATNQNQQNSTITISNESKNNSLGISNSIKIEKVSSIRAYIANKNDSIFKIAKLYNCTPNEILEWNNIALEDTLKEGQEILILK